MNCPRALALMPAALVHLHAISFFEHFATKASLK